MLILAPNKFHPGLVFTEIVQLPQNQNLEHQHPIVFLASGIDVACLGKSWVQHRAKPFPVHHLRYRHQWVTEPVELRKSVFKIKKPGGRIALSYCRF